MKGEFARSLSGHDKGRVYVIIEEHEDYLMLSDGKRRPLEKLKRKNVRHVETVKKHLYNEELINRLENGETLKNEEIKRAVKLYSGAIGVNSDVEG